MWLGPSLPDASHLPAAAERDLLLPPALPPAAEGLPASGLLPPGRRCTVAYVLDSAAAAAAVAGGDEGRDPALSGSTAAGSAAGGPAPPAPRPAASFEERQRGECAERLCRRLALFYRVDADEAGLPGAWRAVPARMLGLARMLQWAGPSSCGAASAQRSGSHLHTLADADPLL